MNLLRLRGWLCLLATVILNSPLTSTYASVYQAELADIQVTAVGVMTNGQPSAMKPCHKSLASCTVILKIIPPPAQGFVDITNNSANTIVYNLRADLTNYSDITQDSSNCAVLYPQQTCRLVLFSGTEVHDPGGPPVPVLGQFIKNIMYFDIVQD